MKKIIIPILLLFMLMPFIVNAKPLSVTDCDNNTLYTTIPSNLKGLAKIMAKNAYLDNGQSEYVNSCNGVSFADISSDTNGKGVYEIASTKNDTYPIYYYRGQVNNNVKFAGFCWKAIRTTDDGGVKLIYNGEPDSNGKCSNTTGTSTQIGKSAFNPSYSSPADVGYMYGTRYTYSSRYSSNLATAYIYGNDVTYSGGTYTLTDTMTSTGTWATDYNTFNNNHYTCFSTRNTCSSVYYIYYTGLYAGAYYISLTNGKKVSDALDEMFNGSNVNANNSTAKTEIDNWYNTNLSSYTSYIEDTIYCNDRSISQLGGWNPDGGSTTSMYSLNFSPYTRTWTDYKPNLECSRIKDRFTVSGSIGNGALTYPVGLITSDEIMYAGGKANTANNTFYLYNNQEYWSSSPGAYYYGYESAPLEFAMVSVGAFNMLNVKNIYGLRPVISLKSSNSVSSGNGTSTNPYVIDVNNEYFSIAIDENSKTENIDIDTEDTSYVKSGERVTFKITPIDDYVIDNIKIVDEDNNEISFNSTGNENEYRFVMPDSDVTIIPTYKKNKYEVNIDIENETEEYDINIENLASVLVGENVVFKVTPIKGYKINNIKIIDSNNNEIAFNPTDNNNEYSFIMPESNVTIIPSYEKVSSSVNVEDNKNTKELVIEVNDSKAVVYDDIVVFRITPKDGYEIDNIIITDQNNNNINYEKISNKNEYKFKMPDTDVFIKPVYRKVEVNNNNIKNPKTGVAISILIILAIVITISSYIKKQKLQFN